MFVNDVKRISDVVLDNMEEHILWPMVVLLTSMWDRFSSVRPKYRTTLFEVFLVFQKPLIEFAREKHLLWVIKTSTMTNEFCSPMIVLP